MSTSPPIVNVRPNDTSKLVDFPGWHHSDGLAIRVDSVQTLLFGAIRPLPNGWFSSWKFVNVGVGTGGTGVKGEIVFDRTASLPVECLPYFDKVLWPQAALLNLWCSNPNDGGQVLLQIQLTP